LHLAEVVASYLVVGSGATGVHFARTALDLGHTVELIDVGYERPHALFPEATYSQLKERLDDPEEYLLGERGEAVVYPSRTAKPYGFPPSKGYVFRRPRELHIEERAFQPFLSFARGGLAEAWTGGSYEMADEEFIDFPFGAAAMRPHYATVASRIGITAADDDLRRFSPLTAPYLSALEMDDHSAAIQARYESNRSSLHARGFHMGRSRVAVLSRDHGARGRCTNLGRCFWGCPRGAFYTPGLTLEELFVDRRFTYRPGLLVRRLVLDANGHVKGVIAAPASGGTEVEIRGDRTILAAGALASSHIYLQTLRAQGRKDLRLPGLMDNRQAMVPFVTLSRLGAPVQLASYQYHMLAMGIAGADWRSSVHGQISALKTAAVHPIASTLPFDLATSMRVFRRMRGALGVANIWLADTRREENVVRLENGATGETRLVLDYSDDASDLPATHRAVAITQRSLRTLGCIAPKAMTRILARGSSVHYAGTLPMSLREDEHTTRADGASRAFPGLHIVDGAGFPWLPAKNLTFTLMANATRIATLLG
jgi:choline dehydrogenase-like flavoprotein